MNIDLSTLVADQRQLEELVLATWSDLIPDLATLWGVSEAEAAQRCAAEYGAALKAIPPTIRTQRVATSSRLPVRHRHQ